MLSATVTVNPEPAFEAMRFTDDRALYVELKRSFELEVPPDLARMAEDTGSGSRVIVIDFARCQRVSPLTAGYIFRLHARGRVLYLVNVRSAVRDTLSRLGFLSFCVEIDRDESLVDRATTGRPRAGCSHYRAGWFCGARALQANVPA